MPVRSCFIHNVFIHAHRGGWSFAFCYLGLIICVRFCFGSFPPSIAQRNINSREIISSFKIWKTIQVFLYVCISVSLQLSIADSR